MFKVVETYTNLVASKLLQAYAQTNVTVSHIGQNIQEVFDETFIFWFITIGFEIIVIETIPPFQQLILVVTFSSLSLDILNSIEKLGLDKLILLFMGLKVTERIISMQHMKLVLLHYVFGYWSWSNDENIARVYVKLSTP